MGRIGSSYHPPAKHSEDAGLATEKNIRDMAIVMSAEAGGEFESSKIAVGWTLKNPILNRNRLCKRTSLLIMALFEAA